MSASRPPTPNRKLVVTAILLGMFMAAMEATVVATAMPTVIADLSGLELYGWVGSIYMLATTVTIPLWGKLSDLRGRKSVMLIGLTVFLIGSVASGMAPTMGALIAFRAIQGIGAGALQPIAMTIIGDIFTVEERARMQGIFGAVWGIAAICGPLLGGLIVKALSWRFVFYVNVPFGLLSAALLIAFFEEKVERAGEKITFDALGAVLLVVTILSVLGAASGRGGAGWLLPVAALALAAFLAVEKRAKEPILPLHLFGKKVIAVSSAVSALLGAVMMGSLMYTPLFVQAVRGGSPTDGGTSVAPMLIGWPIASAMSARLLVSLGFRPLVRAGLVGLSIATACLAFAIRSDLPLGAFRVVMFFMGAGMGLVTTSMLIAVQDAVEWHERGVATSSSMFFRTIGGAVLVGVLGGILAKSLGGAVPESDLAKMLGPERALGIPKEKLASYADALGRAMGPLFVVVAGCALLALAIGFAFPAVRVRKRGAGGAPEPPSHPSSQTPATTETTPRDAAPGAMLERAPSGD
jgi:EmrB/QacA subfamily drug resistance transporter